MTSDNNDASHDALQFGGSVWFRSGEQALGGTQRIALLAAIG